MKRDDLDWLWKDVMNDSDSGLQTLLAAAKRKRQLRTTIRMAGCLVVALGLWTFWQMEQATGMSNPAVARSDPQAQVEPAQVEHSADSGIEIEVRLISKSEMIAMLGDQPYAIITNAGQEQLILLDEE